MQRTGTGAIVGLVVAGIIGVGVCTPVFAGPDTSPPRITSVTLSDSEVVLGPDGTGRLRVDVRLTDGTGVLDAVLTLLPGGSHPPAVMRLASGTRRDGVWTFTVRFDRDDVGAYAVRLSPTDASDNTYVEQIGQVVVREAVNR